MEPEEKHLHVPISPFRYTTKTTILFKNVRTSNVIAQHVASRWKYKNGEMRKKKKERERDEEKHNAMQTMKQTFQVAEDFASVRVPPLQRSHGTFQP